MKQTSRRSEFPPPSTEVEASRYKEARAAVTEVLQDVIASAEKSGWGAEEIVLAIVEVGQALKEATVLDRRSDAEGEVMIAARKQIGRGEQYD